MVYIQDGKVLDHRSFSLRTIIEFFWSIVLFAIYFFRTLVGLESGRNNSSEDLRPGGPRGGPGGGGGGLGGRPPRPRTIGRITTNQDSPVPGCGCGR